MPNFTRIAIKESFWKLLNQRPLNQITVKDIVEDCGINRNSFYYHFQDMPSLIEEMVEDLIETNIKNHPTIESFEECLNVIVNFVLENKKAVYHIYNSVDHAILEKFLLDMCEYAVKTYIDTTISELPLKEEDKELVIRYHKCECFGQIIEWLNNGMQKDILEDIHRFCDLSKGITKELIDNSRKSK